MADFYRGKLRSGETVAMKVYKKECYLEMQNENSCLERLKSSPAAVPRVVAYAPEHHLLLLAPVAMSLEQLCASRKLSVKDACRKPLNVFVRGRF